MTEITKDDLNKLSAFLASVESEKLLGHHLCGNFDGDKLWDGLKALEELPKLNFKSDQYDKFLEYAEKTQRIRETRRGSEEAPFTPREGIISLIPMDFKEFVSYQKLKAENEELKKSKYYVQIDNLHNGVQLYLDKNYTIPQKITIDEYKKLQQESKQAIEIVKRLEEFVNELKSNGLHDDCLNGEVIHRLQSILKGDTN